jgi:long-chain acyl-CoA synthetase
VLDSLLSATLRNRREHHALAYGDQTMTFGRLSAAVDRLAAALAVAPGERVAVVAPNVPALPVGLLATWRAGAVAVPLSARLRRFELRRAFADAQPAAAVSVRAHAGFELAQEIDSLADSTPTVRACIVVDDRGQVIDKSRCVRAIASVRSDDGLAAILYTSGTTGEPKGALVPKTMVEAEGRNLPELLAQDADAAYGLVVPASHAFGLGCFVGGVAGGACAVLVDSTTSLNPLLRSLERHAAGVLHGTPALFGALLRSGATPSLRAGFTAGSSCPPDIVEAFDRRGMRLLNLFGMTEIGAATSCRRDDPAQTRYRTVGRPLTGYEARAVSGEIQVRSEYLPSGYHGRPFSEAECTSDGWFRTGDLGEIDTAGNVIIKGRAKEVVQVGGFNVFPAEVEGFLLTHPAIAQAAVVGVPHPALGEALCAFVVPAADSRLVPRDVIGFARRGIAGYKVPYEVSVVDELPLLPSGKPDRRQLAGAARREEALR